MSHPNPGPTRAGDERVRTHVKALIDEAKHQTASVPGPGQMFFSGMLSGLAAAMEILDGGTAEGSMETMVQRLSAVIGKAYLDGKLPAQPPAEPDAGDPQPSSEEQIRGVQAWMAMDIHQALGLDHAEGLQHQGRKSWADWWAELCASLRAQTSATDRVRRLSEMTIRESVRVHARQQALDTLAALDNVSSPADAMKAAGTLVDREIAAGVQRCDEAAETTTRVFSLYEQWVKAGPPPLGTSIAREWDRRLAELHAAIQPPEQTTEK